MNRKRKKTGEKFNKTRVSELCACAVVRVRVSYHQELCRNLLRAKERLAARLSMNSWLMLHLSHIVSRFSSVDTRMKKPSDTNVLTLDEQGEKK
jgi:hypothetical protein